MCALEMDQAQVLQRLGDVVQQPGTVAAVDFDHGMRPAGVVDQHPRLDLEHLGPRRQRLTAGQRLIEPDPALEHLFDVAPDALEPLRRGDALRSSAFCRPKLSSAMPSAVVKMRASTMLAPLRAMAPAIFMNRPGWSG